MTARTGLLATLARRIRTAGGAAADAVIPYRREAKAHRAERAELDTQLRRTQRALETAKKGTLVAERDRERLQRAARISARALRSAAHDGELVEAIDELIAPGDLDERLVAAARRMIDSGDRDRARGLATALAGAPERAELAKVIEGIAFLSSSSFEEAWRSFSAVDRSFVLPLAPVEYVNAAFAHDEGSAAEAVQHLVSEDESIEITTQQWIDLAGLSVAAGRGDLATTALAVAERHYSASPDPSVAVKLEWMRHWVTGMELTHAEEVPGAVSFGVIDYKQPDYSRSSKNLGDYVQTIAGLGHLVRHQNFEFVGEAGLDEFAVELQDQVRHDRRLDTPTAKFALTLVQRDGSQFHAVPPNTWMFAFGWYKHATFGKVEPLVFHENIRPVFVSLHLDVVDMLTPETIEYMKKYGPVGCRDWNTVHLLLAAGVPAFFSGCITTTVDTVFAPRPDAGQNKTIVVDVKADERGDRFAQEFADVRGRSFMENIRHAREVLEGYRDTYARVITSRLHSYLPARALGARVDFRPRNPSDSRFDGLADLDDRGFDAMRDRMLGLLERIVTMLASGATEQEVYEAWRSSVADDVERAREKHNAIPALPTLSFDIAAVCRQARAGQVDRPATQPRSGDPVHVELSLDGNLKSEMLVTVHSILRTTDRPVHFWVLARDHDQQDFDRVSRVFPEASFTWIPTDHIDYGDIGGLFMHTTVATIDRLLLPDLIPELDRIIHFDIDAVCLSDIGELWDADLGGNPLSARITPNPRLRSGFTVAIHAARRMRRETDTARELIVRTHGRHSFDFNAFNAGIMVLDLGVMRGDGFCEEFLPWVQRFGLHDQDVLVQYVGKRLTPLPRQWNVIPKDDAEIADAKALHWAGRAKPWGKINVAGRETYARLRRETQARVAAAGH